MQCEHAEVHRRRYDYNGKRFLAGVIKGRYGTYITRNILPVLVPEASGTDTARLMFPLRFRVKLLQTGTINSLVWRTAVKSF